MASKKQRQDPQRFIDEARIILMRCMHTDALMMAIPATVIITFLVMSYPDLKIPLDLSALDFYLSHWATLLSASLLLLLIARAILFRLTRIAISLSSMSLFILLFPLFPLSGPWQDTINSPWLGAMLMISKFFVMAALSSLGGCGLLFLSTYTPRPYRSRA